MKTAEQTGHKVFLCRKDRQAESWTDIQTDSQGEEEVVRMTAGEPKSFLWFKTFFSRLLYFFFVFHDRAAYRFMCVLRVRELEA